MDKIILIAKQLHQEGKVPTTALLKSRLPKDVPLVMIIQGLKMWKENPDQKINGTLQAITDSTDEIAKTSIDRLIDARINQAIAPLIARIRELQTALDKLHNPAITEDKN